MWVLEGRFDGKDQPFQKLLKPEGSYIFGRKEPADLILADKTISREAATLAVQSVSSNDVVFSDLNQFLDHKPQVTVRASKKLLRIVRAHDEEKWRDNPAGFVGNPLDPESSQVLQDGDTLILAKSAPTVKLRWIPMNLCVHFRLKDLQIESKARAAAQLPLQLSRNKTLLERSTHLVIEKPRVSVILMQALVRAIPIVTPDFMNEILDKATLSRTEYSSYENRFTLPDTNAFLPEIDPTDGLSEEDMRRLMKPAPRRSTLFVGTTLYFIVAGELEEKTFCSMVDIVEHAGARIEKLTVSPVLENDQDCLRLLRGKKSDAQSHIASCGEEASEAPDDGLAVIVISPDKYASSSWYKKLCKCTRILNIAMPDLGLVAVSKALLEIDARRYLNVMAPEADHSVADNTVGESDAQHADPMNATGLAAVRLDHAEDTIQREKQERETSTDPKENGYDRTASSSNEDALGISHRDRTLPLSNKPRRRAAENTDDPLAALFGDFPNGPDHDEGLAAKGEESGATREPAPSPTPRAASRLKRAANSSKPRRSEMFQSLIRGADSEAEANENITPPSDTQERYSKRFRLELEEQDRANAPQSSCKQAPEEPRKHNEDSRTVSKRRLSNDVGVTGSQAPSPKRQQIQFDEREPTRAQEPLTTYRSDTRSQPGNGHSQQKSPITVRGTVGSSREAHGGEESKDDGRDPRFLQAIASNKKGKKAMDLFDKEFNRLRIARPPGLTFSQAAKESQGQNWMQMSRDPIYVDADEIDDPDYQMWQQMDADDFDVHAAGNFVQVDFVPLVVSRKTTFCESDSTHNGLWEGKSNFKKFKAKERPKSKPLIMELEKTSDFELGEAYKEKDKGGRFTAKPSASFQDKEGREIALMGPPPKRGPTQKRSVLADFSEEEDEDEQSVPDRIGIAPSKGHATRKKTIRSSSPKRKSHDEDLDSERKTPDMSLDVDFDVGLGDSSIRASNVKNGGHSQARQRPLDEAPTQRRGGTSAVGSRKRPTPLDCDEGEDVGENPIGIEFGGSLSMSPNLQSQRRRASEISKAPSKRRRR